MINLLKPFIRSKVKFFLSLIVFIVIFFSLIFLINYRNKIIIEISIIENNVNNREITFMLEDNLLLEEIREIANIENIDINKIGQSYIVNLTVNETSDLNIVVDNLDNLGIKASLLDTCTQDELNTYKSVKLIFNIFILVVMIFLTIIIYIQIKLLIMWDMKDISLLKALGYTELYISNIIICKLCIIVLSSNIISVVLFIVFNFIFNLGITVLLLFIPLVIVIILVIIQYPLLLAKLKKLNITNILEK